MVDYHLHPGFSPDATGSVEEFSARARAVGLEEVCFTTHCELDPGRSEIERVVVSGSRVRVESDWVKDYLQEIDVARRNHPGLAVLAGVEVGYEPEYEDTIRRFLERHRFDFVLGAVHCVERICLTARSETDEFLSRFRDPVQVAKKYLERIRRAAASRLFDSLAHIDIHRKYLDRAYGSALTKALAERWPAVLSEIGGSGTGIELNTSALRRGDPEPYPAASLLAAAHEAGVGFFTVGSDAHHPDDVGRDLGVATRLLARLGAQPARFRARERVA